MVITPTHQIQSGRRAASKSGRVRAAISAPISVMRYGCLRPACSAPPYSQAIEQVGRKLAQQRFANGGV
ncbi:MAG: hypothetical protein MI924_10870 [Chloroflexales bacterium]|nr:hypothetical protein [Chloroflexales bacterium]